MSRAPVVAVTVAIGVAVALALLGAAPFAPRAQRAPLAVGGAGASDAFKITLAPIRADKALDFWYRTPPSSAPKLTAVERVNPNDAVLLLVVLEGIGNTGGGKGRVTLRISTVDGAGVTEVLGEDIPAWDGELPPPGILVVSRALPEFALDDEEALGTTQVIVEARDAGSGKTSRSEAALELVPWTYGEAPADAEAFSRWMGTYHQAFQPAQAVRAYLEYADVEDKQSKSWNFAMLGFFRTVFQSAPWLVDHLVARHDACDDAQRMKLFPDPYATITGPQQLDLLWGEFLASGRYAPIRQLITALELAPFEDAVEEFPKSKKTDKDKERFWKGVTFQAARWSLDSNMKQYPLVLAYARSAAEREKLGKEERKQLEALLEKHAETPKRAGR